MKRVGDILSGRKPSPKGKLDEKSIFYFFKKIIEKEYGDKGAANLQPDFWKGKKLFVKTKSSVWANELWLNRKEIAEKINKEIGSSEIDEIKIKNN